MLGSRGCLLGFTQDSPSARLVPPLLLRVLPPPCFPPSPPFLPCFVVDSLQMVSIHSSGPHRARCPVRAARPPFPSELPLASPLAPEPIHTQKHAPIVSILVLVSGARGETTPGAKKGAHHRGPHRVTNAPGGAGCCFGGCARRSYLLSPPSDYRCCCCFGYLSPPPPHHFGTSCTCTSTIGAKQRHRRRRLPPPPRAVPGSNEN